MIFIIILTIIMIQCKKNEVKPDSKTMEQIYYTQEGKPYYLKSVTKNFATYTTAFNNSYSPDLQVNMNSSLAGLPNGLDLKTPKRIIPVCASMSMIKKSDNTISMDIVTPYYHTYLGNGSTNNYYGTKALSKMLPLIDRLFFTDTTHFGFNVRYGEVVYTVDDFINTSDGLAVNFDFNAAHALSAFDDNTWSAVVAGTYATAVTVTYFELQQ